MALADADAPGTAVATGFTATVVVGCVSSGGIVAPEEAVAAGVSPRGARFTVDAAGALEGPETAPASTGSERCSQPVREATKIAPDDN